MDKNFNNRQVLSLLFITLIGIITSVVCKIPLAIGFLPGLFFLIGMVKTKKYSFVQIGQVCRRGISRGKTVIFIMFLVSLLIPSWYEAGTIHQLVSVSLTIITPAHFLLMTFAISLAVSMILGTSIGTLSSIGIPIISSAAAIHIPLEMAAGALISGAFVGDRSSPFSSAHQLLSNIMEVPVKRQFRSIFWTTITAIFIGCLFYGILDSHIHSSSIISFSKQALWGKMSFIKFIPPAILILAVVLRFKIIYAFMASILSASGIAWMDKVIPSDLFHSLLFGVPGLGGGLQGMYLLIIFLVLAGAYNGLLEEYQVIQPFLDRWIATSSSLGIDTAKMIMAALGVAMISGNQTLPIMLTGRAFLSHWSTIHSREELVRVMADSTMVFPAMVPWSVMAIMCSSILGVSLLHYLPFAIFLWCLPFLTILVSLSRQTKRPAFLSKTG